MSLFPYFVCALLGVDSLRGGLAEGNRIFETCFFDTVTTQNDHPRYVKHVLGRIYVFFTLFGYQVPGGGGGGLPRDWYTTCLCSFSPRTAQKSKFSKLVFVIL